MKNKLEDLRNHLFEQLERLADPDLDLDKEVSRATAIVQLAECLIDSGRAESEFLSLDAKSEFFNKSDTTRQLGN